MTGAIIADTLTLDGSIHITYDAALLSALPVHPLSISSSERF